MGVEKFFNTLVSSYKSKLITIFNTTTADILFFDFNSIIHKISNQTVSDLNYLYKSNCFF
jgi:5'-3' exonuclease